MPTILSLSSQVAQGHVGHSANVFVWQRLGIDVIALPTILLSNRPDFPHWAGERVRPELLYEMLAALEANGWLSRIDAVFTGYLPSAAHVSLAAQLIERLKAKRQALFYCCDPILGDNPGGLYVAEEAASALRTELLPLADFLTPNQFELEWLTGKRILMRADAIEAAKRLAATVLATSAPSDIAGSLINLLVDRESVWQVPVTLREGVPHGTGDLIASLFLAHLVLMRSPHEAAALATAGVDTVIEASEGREELNLIGSQKDWVDPASWLYTAVEVGQP